MDGGGTGVETHQRRIVVGVTGASGAMYATRLVDLLEQAGVEVHLIVTPAGRRLLRDELGIETVTADALIGRESDRVVIYPYKDIGAEIASGSFKTDGMVVVPCSSHRLASFSSGLGENLLDRAVAVTLKEMRRLVIVPREMPMSRIDILNLSRLSEVGAIICPASPGFYMLPQRIEDLVDFVVGKILDLLSVPHDLDTRWSEQLVENRSKGRGPDVS